MVFIVRGGPERPTDILSFKEEKAPTTGTQMIAVVAYYLAHLASERQDFITTDDIQKYFVQAKFPMPGSKSDQSPTRTDRWSAPIVRR